MNADALDAPDRRPPPPVVVPDGGNLPPLSSSLVGRDRECLKVGTRDSITSIETVKSWLGKMVGRPLLCIRYVGADGPDAVAFLVRAIAAWETALRVPR